MQVPRMPKQIATIKSIEIIKTGRPRVRRTDESVDNLNILIRNNWDGEPSEYAEI